MHGDIAKTDHAFEMPAKFLIQQGSLLEQRESLTAFSGNSKPVAAHQMHRSINGRLTGALQVQQNGVLLRKVGGEFSFVAEILFIDPPQAALYNGRLAQQHLIYRFAPGVVCPREYRDALRSGGRSLRACASHILRLLLCRRHKGGYRP